MKNKFVLTALTSACFLMHIQAQQSKNDDIVVIGRSSPANNSSSNKNKNEDLKSKEVSVEVNASKTADIFVENTSRSIEVKTWDQPKVKVVTTIYFEGDANKLSDEEWFEKLNISLKSLGTTIRIKSGSVGSGTYSYFGNNYAWSGGSASGVAIFNGEGENIRTKSNAKRLVTIYIPKDNKLDIESKYSDVVVGTNVTKLDADITNGSLELQDVGTLFLRSKYANVAAGNIKVAEIDFMNGRFTAREVGDADIDTKYATIEMASVDKLMAKSTNDEYEIEEVGSFQGRKNYGNLRITKLLNSIELTGTNADVKIRNIAASIKSINFDNKYADIRLPMRNVKNYTLHFIGAYSNIYADFEKKPYEGKEIKTSKETDNLASQLRAVQRSVERFAGDDSINSKFTAVVGDGKGTKIEMNCQNCTVDFK
ncbi:MAG: hypothetical protein ACOVNY_01520 [Chitinophagaceae bacterium]